MARYKLNIQKRQHRERAQPLHRQRLGILEKHKDYIKRAKDYHSKQDRIHKLRQKASLKNPDEFYFEMINSRTENGVHIKNNGNHSLDTDLVKLLKTQDFNYIKTFKTIEENKINKLKERLGSMVTRVPNQDSFSQSELNLEITKLIRQSTSSTKATNLDSSADSQLSSHEELSNDLASAQKTIFVDSIDEVKNFDFGSIKKHRKHSESSKSNGTQSLSKESQKGKFKEEFSDAEDELTPDPEAHMKKLMRELQSRMNRLKVLQTAERELEIKKALMGKGAKFLKFGPRSTKLKGLINGRDLSWYDKLDRQAIMEEEEEKQQKEKMNSGIKTGARVWKWKAERKR
ncbi:hypothetical protein O181_064150 [Austropuccinia psidii MF-1]|uniref:U3 small nucleolar RNA-associated protein 11 n=1 Tax=Austropuccinia psidii MF-1 TaxID=1389203 RepID=A0A9Q3ESM5_9BASI|nr:hypothetical protein [Austropuccinia psidii MF-1]